MVPFGSKWYFKDKVVILLYIYYIFTSVRPIVRTSRTAFVCASDYDDRTQFRMFEQKKRTWIKIIFKEIAGLSVVLPVRKSEKKV